MFNSSWPLIPYFDSNQQILIITLLSGQSEKYSCFVSQVITHVLSDSSTQHGEIQPVMLSKSFSSTGTAPNAAGTCTPPVVASSNQLARTSGQRKCNQIDSQEGRVLNVICIIHRYWNIWILFSWTEKHVHHCAGARMKKRDSDCQTERLKRKAVTRVNVHDSGPCLEVEVCLSVIRNSIGVWVAHTIYLLALCMYTIDLWP